MSLTNGLPSCEDVKKLDLVDYLGTLEIYPASVSGNNYWYHSPLPDRNDNKPSFKVDRFQNVWYDQGIGKGGTIIDFGIAYFRCTIHEFLEKFRIPIALSHIEAPSAAVIGHTADKKVIIRKISAVRSPVLIRYLKSRMIPLSLATRYLKEVEFSINKTHIALGFRNNSGGYELRNPIMKVSSSPKDATIIKNGSSKLGIFEGWPDWITFLSLIGGYPSNILDYLILNSLSFLNVYLALIEFYEEVWLYLDHNAAGYAATQQALSRGPKFHDKSQFYDGYEDINYWRTHMGMGIQVNLIPNLF